MDKDIKLIKPVIEGDKLHYQTEPYMWDGELIIQRLCSIPIKIIDPLATLKLKKGIKDLEDID